MPVREEVLVEVYAVMVKLVEPLEPVEGETVIHEGLLTVSQEKFEVMVTFSVPPSAEKLKEVTLAEMASPSTGVGLGIFSGLQEASITITATSKIFILFILSVHYLFRLYVSL